MRAGCPRSYAQERGRPGTGEAPFNPLILRRAGARAARHRRGLLQSVDPPTRRSAGGPPACWLATRLPPNRGRTRSVGASLNSARSDGRGRASRSRNSTRLGSTESASGLGCPYSLNDGNRPPQLATPQHCRKILATAFHIWPICYPVSFTWQIG